HSELHQVEREMRLLTQEDISAAAFKEGAFRLLMLILVMASIMDDSEREIHSEKDEDGFLYVAYSGENTFGF
uniref:Uncharacterized protein n=1 Tax=Aquila chrysaetos chrysaetos TaxID=223781 RepID=A0A663F748_AQUCH